MRNWIKRTAGLLALLFLAAAVTAGCARRPETTEDGRLKVVTTLFPYYDFVRQVAGDRVNLALVVPAGMDSHSFEPTPADMITIQEADVLICNGGEMEHWLSQVLDSIDKSHMKIVTMMDYVDAVEEANKILHLQKQVLFYGPAHDYMNSQAAGHFFHEKEQGKCKPTAGCHAVHLQTGPEGLPAPVLGSSGGRHTDRQAEKGGCCHGNDQ